VKYDGATSTSWCPVMQTSVVPEQYADAQNHADSIRQRPHAVAFAL